jgi:hypothetical protein
MREFFPQKFESTPPEWATDCVASLCESHAELMACGDRRETLALFPQIDGLLSQGRQDLILAAARQIQSDGSDGDALDFMDLARKAACSFSRNGITQELFCVPISMGSRPRSNVRNACGPVVVENLLARDPHLMGSSLRTAPALVRHDLLSQLDLTQLHALRVAMSGDDWQAAAEVILAQDPKAGSAWNAQVLDEPCHLYWVVGLSTHKDDEERDWINGDPDGGFSHFMDTTSSRLSNQLGCPMEVGKPGPMARQIKEGAFNEAANGLMGAFATVIHANGELDPLAVRMFKLDDTGILADGASPRFDARSRVLLEMVSPSEPGRFFCRFEFSCSAGDAEEGMADLTRVLHEHAGIRHFEFVGHDAKGQVIVPSSVASDEDDHDFESQTDGHAFASTGHAGTSRPFLH